MALDKKELLEKILQKHPYNTWADTGCDYRDPHQDNASLALSEFGLRNYQTDEFTDIIELARDLNIPTANTGVTQNTPQKLYDKAALNPHDRVIVRAYFNSRGIQITDDVMDDIGLRINYYKEEYSVVAPMYNAPGDRIVSLYRIILNDDYTKKEKRFLGKTDSEYCGITFGESSEEKLLAFEGLEDAVAYYMETGDTACLVVGAAGKWISAKGFLEIYDDVTLILDPDKDDLSMAKSLRLDDTVKRLIPTVDMDCTDAVKAGVFEEWEDSLREVSLNEVIAAATTHKQKATKKKLSVQKWQENNLPRDPTKPSASLLTDIGNAKMLVDHFGTDYRYCASSKMWYIWDGSRWKEDVKLKIVEDAKQVSTLYFMAAEKTEDAKEKTALQQHALSVQKGSRIRDLLALAKSDPRVVLTYDEFDTQKTELNFKNGTLSLDDFKFRTHDPHDLITRCIDFEYDAKAPAPTTWLKFIDDITEQRPELAKYLQKALGYSLSGDTSEEFVFFLYGDGQNGKSTFLRVITELFSEYTAKISSSRVAVQRNGSSIPNDLAHLKEARIAISTEIEQGVRIDEAKIKDMTGRDKLIARHLHKDYFEYTPQFTLWMYGNHKPTIRGTDKGIWRRMKVIPFTAFFGKEECDPYIDEKLMREAQGIINWAVEGCKQWKKDKGIDPPEVVKQAVLEYQQEMDTIGQFVDDCCVMQKNVAGPMVYATKVRDLLNAYKVWCEDMGYTPLPERVVGERVLLAGAVRTQLSKDKTVTVPMDREDTKGQSDTKIVPRGSRVFARIALLPIGEEF